MSLKKSPAALLSKALVFFAVALFAGSSAHAACPSYTHDGDVVLGSKKALPAGWYTYSITSQPGLYTSPLDTFLPVIIPNTSIGNAMVNADISPDGAWILFTRKASTDTGFHTYLIKKNGTGRVEVPFANSTEILST